jgi:hypothetical protein
MVDGDDEILNFAKVLLNPLQHRPSLIKFVIHSSARRGKTTSTVQPRGALLVHWCIGSALVYLPLRYIFNPWN